MRSTGCANRNSASSNSERVACVRRTSSETSYASLAASSPGRYGSARATVAGSAIANAIHERTDHHRATLAISRTVRAQSPSPGRARRGAADDTLERIESGLLEARENPAMQSSRRQRSAVDEPRVDLKQA